ncbi:hypothetical protein TWF694_000348 [Orbilia ellipsospora]|uniref:Wax synthase domain-containing protein n=1 Tax=Orbilia ellipsospora TaxID=2528407 RepID=A0AAV9XQ34_9PEZI
MVLFPPSAIAPFAAFPARLAALESRTPILLHDALLPLFLLFLTLLLYPCKSHTRNAIALPVILGLYARLCFLYSSSHWGIAFCVGAGAYFGSLQAFSLLVVKDVGWDRDVWWTEDDTRVIRDKEHSNGSANGIVNGVTNGGKEKHVNGYANGHTNGYTNGSSSPLGNGVANGFTNGTNANANGGIANGTTKGTSNGDISRHGGTSAGLGYPKLSTYPLLQRIRFTSSLISSSRGVGWKFQIRQIRPPPEPSCSILSHLQIHFTNIAITYLILDCFGYHLVTDPYFSTQECWKSPLHSSPLPDMDWRERCIPSYIPPTPAYAFIYHHIIRKHLTLLSVYAILGQLYSIAAILFTVPIPASKPSSWAPLFGSLSEATSLRGFWTVFWHSIFKKAFSYPGEWMAFRVLGLDRKNIWAQLIIVFTAFGNSGGLHGLGCWTQNGRGGAAALFFLLQPVGFLGEVILMKGVKMLGMDGNLEKTVGRVVKVSWMMVWLLWSCDVFFYDYLHGGIGGSEPVAWSSWRWYVGEKAYRWGPPDEWTRWDVEGSLWGWGVRI